MKLSTLIATAFASAMLTATPISSMAAGSQGYVVKLSGKSYISESGDSLFFYTNKGKKQVYLYGLDEKSSNVLAAALKNKSCVKIYENANPDEMAMGAIIKPAKCPIKTAKKR